MSQRKSLQELTIKNNFMFAAVMLDPQNCQELLELILNIPISRVKVDAEKSLVYDPRYRGIRMDVYVKDENNTCFDVEMQVRTDSIEKRSRYYHSHMDMEALQRGLEYELLPDSYVIFICDFDPVGAGKYVYTEGRYYLEAPEYPVQDGHHTIFLSTCGENKEEVPAPLVRFLEFVKADLPESEKDFGDAFIGRLQDSIRHIRTSREMGEHYMWLELALRDERIAGRAEGRAEGKAEGKAEAILELLSDLGEVPESWRERILAVQDGAVLQKLLKAAARAESLESFEKLSGPF